MYTEQYGFKMFEKSKSQILPDFGQNQRSSSDRSWKTTRNLILGAIIQLKSCQCGWMAKKTEETNFNYGSISRRRVVKPVKSGCFNGTETSFTNLKTSVRNVSYQTNKSEFPIFHIPHIIALCCPKKVGSFLNMSTWLFPSDTGSGHASIIENMGPGYILSKIPNLSSIVNIHKTSCYFQVYNSHNNWCTWHHFGKIVNS